MGACSRSYQRPSQGRNDAIPRIGYERPCQDAVSGNGSTDKVFQEDAEVFVKGLGGRVGIVVDLFAHIELRTEYEPQLVDRLHPDHRLIVGQAVGIKGVDELLQRVKTTILQLAASKDLIFLILVGVLIVGGWKEPSQIGVAGVVAPKTFLEFLRQRP